MPEEVAIAIKDGVPTFKNSGYSETNKTIW
jgi:hypothetical protein